jgi:FkbM family methyltransferase
MNRNASALIKRYKSYPAKMLATFSVTQALWLTFIWVVGSKPVRVFPKSFPEGVWIRPRTTDLRVLYEIFTTRELEMEWPLDELPSSVIDGGANVGYATLALTRRWPDARILAVEPDPENAEMLVRNVGHHQGVEVIQKGIWGFPCSLMVEEASRSDGAWGLRFTPSTEGEQEAGVRAVDLPYLLSRLPGGRCDLLKLDVEGAEISIFADPDASWVDQVSVILVEIHGREAGEVVRRFAHRNGFSELQVGEKLMFWRP